VPVNRHIFLSPPLFPITAVIAIRRLAEKQSPARTQLETPKQLLLQKGNDDNALLPHRMVADSF